MIVITFIIYLLGTTTYPEKQSKLSFWTGQSLNDVNDVNDGGLPEGKTQLRILSMNASELFLAVDVGGTHTRLSLYECEADLFNPAWHKSYRISGLESFISILSRFFDDIGQKP